MITGKNCIAGDFSGKGNVEFKTINPKLNIENPTTFVEATKEEIEEAVSQLAERPFEAESLRHRRSIYVVAEMKAGDLFTTGNLRRIRPGNGLAPEHFEALMGTPCTRDIAAGTPLDIAATTLT